MDDGIAMVKTLCLQAYDAAQHGLDGPALPLKVCHMAS